jgi:hypothetical protein
MQISFASLSSQAYAISFSHPLYTSFHLVLTSRSLARLELIQVPPTDSQATLVLVHALAEVVDVSATRTGRLHLCGVLVLLGEVGVLRRSGGRLG